MHRENKFDEKDVIRKLGNPLRVDEVVAMMKTQDFD